MRGRGLGPNGHHIIINKSHTNHRSWCTFPAFCSHSWTFAWLNVPSFEAASPSPRRLSACNRTVACSTADWELHFSSTAGVESGFEGAEPIIVVGRQVAPDLIRGRQRRREAQKQMGGVCAAFCNIKKKHISNRWKLLQYLYLRDFLEHRIRAMKDACCTFQSPIK